MDTALLREYADILTAVNFRTDDLKTTLESICTTSETSQLRQELCPEILTEGYDRVAQCIRYLKDTATDFEYLEKECSEKIGVDDRARGTKSDTARTP